MWINAYYCFVGDTNKMMEILGIVKTWLFFLLNRVLRSLFRLVSYSSTFQTVICQIDPKSKMAKAKTDKIGL